MHNLFITLNNLLSHTKMIHHGVLIVFLSLVFSVQIGSSNDSALGDAPDPGPKNCCWTCYGTVHIYGQ